MKTVPLTEAQTDLERIFEEVHSGSPVLLVRGADVVKIERVEPPEFGGDAQILENMLLEAVRGPHAKWTPQDLDDIARRVRARKGQ